MEKATVGYSMLSIGSMKTSEPEYGAPNLALSILGEDVLGSIWMRGDEFGEHLRLRLHRIRADEREAVRFW